MKYNISCYMYLINKIADTLIKDCWKVCCNKYNLIFSLYNSVIPHNKWILNKCYKQQCDFKHILLYPLNKVLSNFLKRFEKSSNYWKVLSSLKRNFNRCFKYFTVSKTVIINLFWNYLKKLYQSSLYLFVYQQNRLELFLHSYKFIPKSRPFPPQKTRCVTRKITSPLNNLSFSGYSPRTTIRPVLLLKNTPLPFERHTYKSDIPSSVTSWFCSSKVKCFNSSGTK